ncbi:hypothetical protein QWT69_03745 [Sporosarcina oncorhynchi]|uniref:Uncharacterized protein n=1 Tax=Sporosarcina oncorhynchi TaxID=3056444 RepID=A0ABZ0L839_9BACL|nr:hypothetical protein [Sporosarcina sp. T2O-4]WOV88248.1 hypothetical protein QWT69_03745 [Sporosarcina sp. T2O-4]
MKEKLMVAWTKMMFPVKNERGAQSLEWLGIAALLILVLGIISTALSGEKDNIGKVVTNIISKISGMVGG